MGPIMLIGILLAGGAAMIPFLGESDPDDGPNSEEPDGFDEQDSHVNPDDLEVDGSSQGQSGDVDSDVGGQADYDIELYTSNNAEWNTEAYTTLTASDFSELSNITNEPLVVQNGSNEESINARDVEHGIFYIGEGDSIIGSNVASEIYDLAIITNGAADVEGGQSDEVILANEGGSDVDGGAGEDLIISDSKSDTIFGGAGDDTIFGNGANLFEPTAGNNSIQFRHDDPDYIDGGSGDDLIIGSTGDTIIGGDGADEIYAYDGNANIVDFEPGADVLKIPLSSGALNVDPTMHESYNLDGRIDLSRTGDELKIILDGNEILSLNCNEVTTVGYYNGIDSNSTNFLTAQTTESSVPDIILYVEHQYTS